MLFLIGQDEIKFVQTGSNNFFTMKYAILLGRTISVPVAQFWKLF